MSRDRFSEELFEAITDIDDELILEADETNVDNQVIQLHSKKRNRYLMIAACFAFIVVVSIPIISLMDGEFLGLATKDEAALEMSDEESFDMYKDDAESGIVNDVADSANGSQGVATTSHPNIACIVEEFNGYTIYTNYYYGYILDDPAKDPQEVLSLMKVTEINEKSYYIVVVRDERVKVYDAKTLEPLVDNEGSSIDDVALELGIAG